MMYTQVHLFKAVKIAYEGSGKGKNSGWALLDERDEEGPERGFTAYDSVQKDTEYRNLSTRVWKMRRFAS